MLQSNALLAIEIFFFFCRTMMTIVDKYKKHYKRQSKWISCCEMNVVEKQFPLYFWFVLDMFQTHQQYKMLDQ